MRMTEPKTPIVEVNNLGKSSAAWLAVVGIETYGDLESVGAIEAYQRVRAAGFQPSRNLLYALEAALLGIHFTELPEAEKSSLDQALNG